MTRRLRRFAPPTGLALAAVIVLLLGPTTSANAVSQDAAALPAAPMATPAVKPSAATTGVPAGTTLRKVTGNMTITKAGTVLDSVDLYGSLRIEAENVTVKRSIIRGSSTTGGVVVYAGSAAVKNFVMQDVEISPTKRTYLTNGVFGHDMTLRRVDIHHVIDSVHVFGGDNVLIENSYLHYNLHFGPGVDPGHADGSHDDSVQIQGGRNIVIRNNYLTRAYNSAVQVTQDAAVVSGLTIQNNWIEGGGCSLNIADGSLGRISGLTISGNKFGSSRFSCPVLVSPATRSIAAISSNALYSGSAIKVICRSTSGNYHC